VSAVVAVRATLVSVGKRPFLDCAVPRRVSARLGGVVAEDEPAAPCRRDSLLGLRWRARTAGAEALGLCPELGIAQARVEDAPVEIRPEPDDYLLYPEKRTPDRRVYWADTKKPCASNTMHRWWYRMLEQAGLVGHGVRSGLNMHRARHTFATELRRVAGVEAASQALGHTDLSTTLGIYGDQDQRDLERAMEAFANARESDEEASRGNDSPSRLD
jgi:integrase